MKIRQHMDENRKEVKFCMKLCDYEIIDIVFLYIVYMYALDVKSYLSVLSRRKVSMIIHG